MDIPNPVFDPELGWSHTALGAYFAAKAGRKAKGYKLKRVVKYIVSVTGRPKPEPGIETWKFLHAYAIEIGLTRENWREVANSVRVPLHAPEALRIRKPRKNKPTKPPKPPKPAKENRPPRVRTSYENFNAFYDSKEWRQLRYRALKQYGARCQCCGGTAISTGKPLHVDHVKPRFKYPALELDISNLQILCEDCNMGKGGWDQTDWRAA